jgi:hypothetical protein
MRHLAILSAALILMACSTATTIRSQSQAASSIHVPASELQKASMEPPVQFLVSAAATDFHTHRPPYPARFRDVRIGHVMTSKGEKQYILCGQFLPEQEIADAEWTPFATIKTDPYEQWIGVQASGLCQQSSIAWDEEGDLSSSLQSQLDSLQ